MASRRTSLEDLSPSLRARYDALIAEARESAKDAKLKESIALLKQAHAICFTEKLEKRIQKMEQFMEEHGADDLSEDKMIEICPGFSVHSLVYERLYPYQREGVRWLYQLHLKKKGGIIGDDMGLGKTIQIIAFLSGMFDAEQIKSVLLVMPLSLIPNWQKEFDDWAPGITVLEYHGNSARERERNLSKIQRRGGVLITTYGLMVTSGENFATCLGREFVWDYVILDEGHKIKNPTKTTKAIHAVPSRNRIVLTGTPIQNNLNELWALYDYVHQGELLGSKTTFMMQYGTPITRSREKDASAGERRLGIQIAESLRKLIAPYFLRRTKAEVLQQKQGDKENVEPDSQLIEKFSFLSGKNDLIVWTFLSDAQIQIYKDFLDLDHVKNLLMTTRSPLVELTVLKKICDHPRLLSKRACIQLGLSEPPSSDNLEEGDSATDVMSINDVPDEKLIQESGKLSFLMQLLENLRQENHRTLIFSQSRKMLDIIHRILQNRNWKVMRLDGTVTKTEDRHKRIAKFQQDNSVSVFLLTTQVGGVGLTLTAADRVVIYDPSWNPATDAQAVDRVYRIGQKKKVLVYRLITCGTVEEKIYRRQIFKDSIIKQTTGSSKDPHRYFTRQELRELFTLDNPTHSKTQMQLQRMHGNQRQREKELEDHIAYLYSLNIFGTSDHDLLFSKEVFDDELDYDDGIIGEEDIRRRVERAQQLVQTEAAMNYQVNQRAGTFARQFSDSKKKWGAPNSTTKQPFPDVIDVDGTDAFEYKHGQLGNNNGYIKEDVLVISDEEDEKDWVKKAGTSLENVDFTIESNKIKKESLVVPENHDSSMVQGDILASESSGEVFAEDSSEQPQISKGSTDSLDANLANMTIEESHIEDSLSESQVTARQNKKWTASACSSSTPQKADGRGRGILTSTPSSSVLAKEQPKTWLASPLMSKKVINTPPIPAKTPPKNSYIDAASQDSLKRITPVRVPANISSNSQTMSPFQKAIANAIEIGSEEDSSIIQPTRKQHRVLDSDSGSENDSQVDDFCDDDSTDKYSSADDDDEASEGEASPSELESAHSERHSSIQHQSTFNSTADSEANDASNYEDITTVSTDEYSSPDDEDEDY